MSIPSVQQPIVPVQQPIVPVQQTIMQQTIAPTQNPTTFVPGFQPFPVYQQQQQQQPTAVLTPGQFFPYLNISCISVSSYITPSLMDIGALPTVYYYPRAVYCEGSPSFI